MQVGAELYGEASVEADIEVISLMLETLASVGLDRCCLDLGHVAIYRQMVALSAISESVERELFAALQSKAEADIAAACQSAGLSEQWTSRFVQLANCHGGPEVLDLAHKEQGLRPQVPPFLLSSGFCLLSPVIWKPHYLDVLG